jgi:hypothetical protein
MHLFIRNSQALADADAMWFFKTLKRCYLRFAIVSVVLASLSGNHDRTT